MANSFAAQLADALEHSWPAVARSNQKYEPQPYGRRLFGDNIALVVECNYRNIAVR
jgi:hypothetical protein